MINNLLNKRDSLYKNTSIEPDKTRSEGNLTHFHRDDDNILM